MQDMPKSQVAVFTRDNYLHLRWSYQSKQYRLSTRLPDTKENRKAVQAKVKLIESDIAYERLDTTLEKYGKLVKKPEPFKELPFYSVWHRFLEYKSHVVQKNTLEKYKAASSRVFLCCRGYVPSVIKLNQPSFFLGEFGEKIDGKTLKERLGYLSACWKWGQKEGLILSKLKNPFEGLAEMIKPQPKQPPKPFTKEEANKILDWFYDFRYDYHPYVQFLLNTGCRISEVIGLRWRHIGWDVKSIWIGESLTRGTRKSTKTNKARMLPMNELVARTILCAIHCSGRSTDEMRPDDLVFVSPTGKPIDDHNFNQRIWKKCLRECNIPYRRPYNCRHTFISHCLEKGMSPATVASITGHDVQTLYENYAGSVISKPELPELF